MPQEKAEVECPKCGSDDTYLDEHPLGLITSLTTFVGKWFPFPMKGVYLPLVDKGRHVCRNCGHIWKV